MVRVDRITGETMSIRPQPAPGEPAYRWHWDTPFIQSPHDPKTLYAAANKVFRSPDRGLSWISISPDLTANATRDDIVLMGVKNSETRISRNDGIAAWPAIVALAESPKRPGLLCAGTDDGVLQITRDGGKTWTNVFGKVPGVPAGAFVSKVVPSRFDENTVYAAFDGHRQNEFGTYVYASSDAGQTWRSIAANLKDEVARTLTEDLKNPDVLYLGTETGLFVTTDRGANWVRIRANLPTVRIDEITLHPRDNAMLLATHGRSIWILDHLEPVQEWAAAQAAADAKLFSPPPAAMFRRPARDRNYEFWGDQTFFGENPPQAAVITWLLKRPVENVKIKVTDAAGKEVREISGPVLANSNKAGLQSACWDLRVQPLPAAQFGGGGRGEGQAGGAGQAAAGSQPGVPGAAPGGGIGAAQVSPFGAGCAAGGGGFGGGGFGGGAATAGPYVLPGTYNISLIVDGKSVETKPLRVVADGEVALTPIERQRMFDMAMEMHDLQKRATEVQTALRPLNTRMAELTKEIGSRSDVPADVKATFEAFNKDLAAFAPKFAPAAFGRGGGAGPAGPATPPGQPAGPPTVNLFTRLGQAQNGLMATMPVSEQTTKAYAEAKAQVPKAILDANALFARAGALSTALAPYKLTLTAPPPVK
jgi:photosystem II stability/assembly factor-like uncharacterized protein